MNTLIFQPDSLKLNGEELFPEITPAAISRALRAEPVTELVEGASRHRSHYIWHDHGLSVDDDGRLSIYGNVPPPNRKSDWTHKGFLGTISLWNRFLLETDTEGSFVTRGAEPQNVRATVLEQCLTNPDSWYGRDVRPAIRPFTDGITSTFVRHFIDADAPWYERDIEWPKDLLYWDRFYLWKIASNGLEVRADCLRGEDTINCYSSLYDPYVHGGSAEISFWYPTSLFYRPEIELDPIFHSISRLQIPCLIQIQPPRFRESKASTQFQTDERRATLADSKSPIRVRQESNWRTGFGRESGAIHARWFWNVGWKLLLVVIVLFIVLCGVLLYSLLHR